MLVVYWVGLGGFITGRIDVVVEILITFVIHDIQIPLLLSRTYHSRIAIKLCM